MHRRLGLFLFVVLATACTQSPDPREQPSGVVQRRGAPRDAQPVNDSAARAFAERVVDALLDTDLYELRATISVMIPNPNRDDESPLAGQRFEHMAMPGPHTLSGVLYAEVEALRALLDREVVVTNEREKVFVGTPPKLLYGHFHGEKLYVPVKLFARQYGAYVDVSCTLANCASIWPRAVIDHMKRQGYVGATGMLEAHAEGIVTGIDVRRLPGG